ncbi:MAG TPA: SPOR domain-containing protein [Thermodesulfobacteriota bacterium]|jgi:cell division septation protein DedD
MLDDKNNPGKRQIVYFFLGFLVLFIFTFSLGVIVGKGLGDSETLIISKEVSPKTSGRSIKESKQETRAARDSESQRGESTPFTSREGEMAEAEKKVNTPSTTDKPVEKKIETEKGDSTSSEILSEQPTPTAQPVEMKPELEVKETQTKSSPAPTPIDKKIKQEPKKEEVSTEEIAAIPTARPEGEYTVQIGAFQKEEEAKEMVNNLKSKGYPVFIKTTEVHGKGTLYRVRIGKFSSREIARVYAVNLKNMEPSIKFVFVTVNN